MKTTLNTKTFINTAGIAAGYCDKKEIKIVFCFEDTKTISIKATDMIEAINLKLACNVEEFESFSVDARNLINILKVVKTEEVHLQANDKQLIIKSGRTKAKIDLLAETIQFASDSKLKTEFCLTNEMLSSLKVMEHSIDASNPRAELNGMLMSCTNNLLTFVGSDTRRLCIEKNETNAADFEVIIPKSALKTLMRCNAGVVVSINETEFCIRNEFQKYTCKYINSKYVEYKRIIPQSWIQNIKLDKQIFAEVLKEASVIDNNVFIEISNNKLKVFAIDGSIQTEREIPSGNTNLKFAVMARFILDYLSACEGSDIQLSFNEALLPFSLVKSPTSFEILMPINTNEN